MKVFIRTLPVDGYIRFLRGIIKLKMGPVPIAFCIS